MTKLECNPSDTLLKLLSIGDCPPHLISFCRLLVSILVKTSVVCCRFPYLLILHVAPGTRRVSSECLRFLLCILLHLRIFHFLQKDDGQQQKQQHLRQPRC
mmetsp:Transcript_24964/g.36673  ORF Transcript_24964/g.36673 Transcript_24964/m.36673 type:complete len:101 (-) Transcript_24964:740-1042(-)